ncbi:MAG TPA: hypothetical protein VF680_16985 [Allosphingosinicella sp.]|jgi:hypothetical protein
MKKYTAYVILFILCTICICSFYNHLNNKHKEAKVQLEMIRLEEEKTKLLVEQRYGMIDNILLVETYSYYKGELINSDIDKITGVNDTIICFRYHQMMNELKTIDALYTQEKPCK